MTEHPQDTSSCACNRAQDDERAPEQQAPFVRLSETEAKVAWFHDEAIKISVKTILLMSLLVCFSFRPEGLPLDARLLSLSLS